jgi:hypothetical protein
LSLTIACLRLTCSGFAIEDATTIREQGIRALKESESNPRDIVEAARSFAKKFEAVEKIAPKTDEAQKWFDRAEKYAIVSPNAVAAYHNPCRIVTRFKTLHSLNSPPRMYVSS